jgi:WD40 repeat protein/DNA-binding SARP family transcriptional activator
VGTSVRFGLLGPLEVWCGGAEVTIAPGKQRAVLAALLLSAGRVVPVDELAEALWGRSPPPSARVTVQNYVMRLRKALGAAGWEGISTRAPGYLISLDAGDLDVTRFEGLLAGARAAARADAWGDAAGQAGAALALWRGDPLSDVESDELVLHEVPRLEELRLQAVEIRIDADLRAGRHGEVIAELQELVTGHPLREHLHAQRMLAFYRDGRQAEALSAYQQARQVLVDELGAEPGTELRELHQRILAADPGLAAPAAGTDRQADPVGSTVSGSRQGGPLSPYRGLSAFRERDTALFFGREVATRQLLDRMARCLNGTGLLVVSGASGAGKSSLLQAGVLPRLRTAGLPGAPGAASWPCLLLTPGRAPLDELAVRVARLAGADAAEVRRGLDVDPAGFALTVRQACLAREQPDGSATDAAGPSRLVLLVDQFEQLFTQCPDEAQRRTLVRALHAVAAAGEDQAQAPPALVVLAVRADFETRCADYPQLVDALQDRYLVTPLTARQLRMAITAPAGAAGSAVDDDLVAVLLREVSTRPPPGGAHAGPVSGAGVLPLLSHALDQAWRNRTGDVLTLADYERAGGIEGAVADSAQRAYDTLTPAQREAARQVFARLTATTDDGTDTADRVPRAELSEGGDPARARDVDAVIEAFAAERLLTLTAESVEISHEVLLSAWPLLRDTWLADTRADRITRTRLRSAAAQWARHSRDPSYLYHGSLLDTAKAAAARIAADARHHQPLSQNERGFLQASDRVRRRTVRRRQLVIALLVMLVIGFASTATVALHASQAAARQRDAAIAGELIAQSAGLGDTNPVLAKLESVAAWRIDPTPQARDAMMNAAALPGLAVLNGHVGAVSTVAFSPDGATLAVAGGNPAVTGPGTVSLWDVAGRRETGVIRTGDAGGVTALVFSPDGKTLAVGTWNGTVSLWDVASRRQVGDPLIRGPGTGGTSTTGISGLANIVKSLAFSQNGNTLAAVTSGGTVRLWNLAIRRPVSAFHTTGVSEAAFSPDGKTLAIGGTGGVWLWNVALRRPVGTLVTGSAATAFVAAFSPDGKTIAVGSLGLTDGYGSVSLWDLSTRRQTGTLLRGAADGITSIAFSPRGGTLVTGGYQGTVRLFDTASRSELGGPLTGDTGAISSAVFSPDGTTVATGSNDGTARLWTGAVRDTGGALLADLAGKDSQAALSPNGKILAIADGTVRLFDVATWRQIGAPLATRAGSVYALAFSRDSATLATASVTKTIDAVIQTWDVATHRQTSAFTFDGASEVHPLSIALSPDGKTLAAIGAADSATGLVRLFNVPAWRETGPSFTGGNLYLGGAFSPDGKTLATSSLDGEVRLWDVATGRQVGKVLSVGSSVAGSLAFSPDGGILAVAASEGQSGTVRLFDVATGEQIGTPFTLSVPLVRLTFSPDGKTLSAVASGGAITRWDVAYTIDPAAYICAAAGRPLTRAEWGQDVQGLPYQDVCSLPGHARSGSAGHGVPAVPGRFPSARWPR